MSISSRTSLRLVARPVKCGLKQNRYAVLTLARTPNAPGNAGMIIEQSVAWFTRRVCHYSSGSCFFATIFLVLVLVILLVLDPGDYEHDYESRARFLWLRPTCRGVPLSIHF